MGTFTRGYTVYAFNDTSCSAPPLALYSISGAYAMHGPSDCGGTCQVG